MKRHQVRSHSPVGAWSVLTGLFLLVSPEAGAGGRATNRSTHSTIASASVLVEAYAVASASERQIILSQLCVMEAMIQNDIIVGIPLTDSAQNAYGQILALNACDGSRQARPSRRDRQRRSAR